MAAAVRLLMQESITATKSKKNQSPIGKCRYFFDDAGGLRASRGALVRVRRPTCAIRRGFRLRATIIRSRCEERLRVGRMVRKSRIPPILVRPEKRLNLVVFET